MIVDANVVFIFIFLVLKLVLCSEIGGIQCESLIDNPLLLGRCVNESLSLLAPISTNQQSKVCMITRVTPEIYSYAGYGLFIQAVFAHAKRYRMLPVYPDSSTPDYAYYRKLVPILEAFDRHSDCDYILWMDADAIPLSFDFDPLTLLPNR